MTQKMTATLQHLIVYLHNEPSVTQIRINALKTTATNVNGSLKSCFYEVLQ